jgi:hypothetical protein
MAVANRASGSLTSDPCYMLVPLSMVAAALGNEGSSSKINLSMGAVILEIHVP